MVTRERSLLRARIEGAIRSRESLLFVVGMRGERAASQCVDGVPGRFAVSEVGDESVVVRSSGGDELTVPLGTILDAVRDA